MSNRTILFIWFSGVLVPACADDPAPEGPGEYTADFAQSEEFFTLMAGPVEGQSPHGRTQIWYSSNASEVIGGPSVPRGTVAIKTADPEADGTVDYHAVMIKESAGYDPDHGDWKYEIRTLAGEIENDENGEPLSGAMELCWSCHVSAASTDYLAGTALR